MKQTKPNQVKSKFENHGKQKTNERKTKSDKTDRHSAFSLFINFYDQNNGLATNDILHFANGKKNEMTIVASASYFINMYNFAMCAFH